MDLENNILEAASAILEQQLPGKHEGDPEFDNILKEVQKKIKENGSKLRSGRSSQDVCGQRNPPCGSGQSFRSIDGKCNNLNNGHWGSANIAARFQREAT